MAEGHGQSLLSHRAESACAARGLSQLQNWMLHLSYYEHMLGVHQWIVKKLVNHKQFPMQMTQNSKRNKWLEILAGEDFPPKLLWRTPTKIHRERRKQRQQETTKQREYRLAKRRQLRQKSDHKHVQRQRQNTTITKRDRWTEGTGTDCRRFKKR